MSTGAVGVQWAVNSLDSGPPNVTAGSWLVWLANNDGVAKKMNASATFDSWKTTTATLTPRFPFARAVDLLGRTVTTSADSRQIRVALGPGDAALVRIDAPPTTDAGRTLGKTDDRAAPPLPVGLIGRVG